MTTNSNNRVSLGIKQPLALAFAFALTFFAVAGLVVYSAPASAAQCPEIVGEESVYGNQCAPGWAVTARNYPTNIAPGGTGTIEVDVLNVGAEKTNGQITVTDELPEGVTAEEAGDLVGRIATPEEPHIGSKFWECTGNGAGGAPNVQGATVLRCTNNPINLPFIPGGAGGPTVGNFGAALNHQPELAIKVHVDPASGEHRGTNRVAVAGGGASAPASTEAPFTISRSTPGFGFTGWHVWFSNADGTRDTQAGSHPYAATFEFDLATQETEEELHPAGGEFRNLEVELPPGFIGYPTAVKQCTREELNELQCPSNSAVGFITAYLAQFGYTTEKIYDMVPPPGLTAELAFNLEGNNTYLDFTLRTNGDYGLTTHVNNNAQRELYKIVTTIWGVPADHSHDRWRTNVAEGCSEEEVRLAGTGCDAEGKGTPQPFLTMPTSCPKNPVTQEPEPLKFGIRSNTWSNAAFTETDVTESTDGSGVPYGLSGCEGLGFGPLISTSPDTSKADSPAGLSVEVKPPVGGLTEPLGRSTADVRNTTVVLPAGMVINPGQAAGLQACQPSQSGVGTEELPSCPLASKVGTLSIKTPLLEGSAEKELQGNVYVLQSNPPNIELLAAASGDGINLKLVGKVSLCEATGEILDEKVCEAPGQLITKFADTPELPFTDFHLSFSGGPQAALDTPTQCGSFTTNADFNPWSSPFIPDFLTSAAYGLSEGAAGGACPANPLPFAPSMIAGATTDQAGGFTNFSMLLQRGDGQQRIEKLQFKAPEGLSGMISSVPLCDEADANAGTCPAASHIGHAVVTSGPGPYPLVLPQPGEPELPIYLTGPYKGAPFGLSIVTPVLAGPFNLGTIVTRASIAVDPHTAAITVTTDALPQIVAGVPTDLRSIDAVIDRPGFMFNPTNCNPQSFSGTAFSAQGAQAAISSPFGVGSCRSLEFKPKFAVSTPGKTTKANGAGLTAKLSYPVAAQGTQSNITRVKVDLPKQLPSRLTTLQKACTNAQFELNPANCPKESKIGYATVHTPLLPVPVSGPAIFVSHGGEAFPSLTMVLQGDNVTVDLVGTTNISHAGITSTTFKTVPDVPFSSFELTLGQGKFSALAANLPAKDHGNFCGQTLAMPTEFLAQNGAKINESTPISISGCAKKKALTRSQKLTAALKACHKRAKGKQAGCETPARKQYGPIKAKKKK